MMRQSYVNAAISGFVPVPCKRRISFRQ